MLTHRSCLQITATASSKDLQSINGATSTDSEYQVRVKNIYRSSHQHRLRSRSFIHTEELPGNPEFYSAVVMRTADDFMPHFRQQTLAPNPRMNQVAEDESVAEGFSSQQKRGGKTVVSLLARWSAGSYKKVRNALMGTQAAIVTPGLSNGSSRGRKRGLQMVQNPVFLNDMSGGGDAWNNSPPG